MKGEYVNCVPLLIFRKGDWSEFPWDRVEVGTQKQTFCVPFAVPVMKLESVQTSASWPENQTLHIFRQFQGLCFLSV